MISLTTFVLLLTLPATLYSIQWPWNNNQQYNNYLGNYPGQALNNGYYSGQALNHGNYLGQGLKGYYPGYAGYAAKPKPPKPQVVIERHVEEVMEDDCCDLEEQITALLQTIKDNKCEVDDVCKSTCADIIKET